MKRIAGVLAIVALVLIVTLGCSFAGLSTTSGSGRVAEQDREISNVTSVELATIGNLYIEIGERESLTVEAEDNLLDYIETEVRNGKLTIDMRPNISLRSHRPIVYRLVVEDLERIELSSSGDAFLSDMETGNFEVRLSSSGDLEMGDLNAGEVTLRLSSSGDISAGDLNASRLDATLSSSGDVEFAGGRVERLELTLSSSGDYLGRRLESDEAYVRCSSSGDATLRVNEYLEARSSSSGDIYYYGDPVVESHTSSSGDVERAGS